MPLRSRPISANRCATRASSPIPATLTKTRPSSEPTSMRRSTPAIAASNAARGSSGMCSSRASPLPEPAGTTPNTVSVNASDAATSLIVPSPPHATTIRAPRRAATAASSRAWPAWVVTTTSTSEPCDKAKAAACSALARAPSRTAPNPAVGFTTTTTGRRSVLSDMWVRSYRNTETTASDPSRAATRVSKTARRVQLYNAPDGRGSIVRAVSHTPGGPDVAAVL